MSASTFRASLNDRTTRSLLKGHKREEEARLVVEDGYDIVDRYWLDRDVAHAVILEHPITRNPQYHVVEPQLSEHEWQLLAQLKQDIRDRVLHRIPPDVDDPEATLREQARDKISHLPAYDIEDAEFERVMYYIRRDLLGRKKIEPLMCDPHLEDISCNGIDRPIYVYHRDFNDHLKTNLVHTDIAALRKFISKLAQRSNKDISSAHPLQGTDLPDGSRLELVRDEVSESGSYTIRKYRDAPFTPPELVRTGTCSIEQLAYLWFLIEHEYNGLVVGGTGAGKTTLLNALSLFIPPRKKIVSIEDTREIQLPHDNWTPLFTREAYARDEVAIGMLDLLREALRMRPDYIPVGEVRDENAKALFQAMATGHTAYSTLHADSMPTVFNRLREDPINIADAQITEVGFVCIQTKTNIRGRTARRSMEVREVLDLEKHDDRPNEVNHDQIFAWDPQRDEIHGDPAATSRHLADLRREGLQPAESIEQRERVLAYLVDADVTRYGRVTTVLESFMRSPETVLDGIDSGHLQTALLEALE